MSKTKTTEELEKAISLATSKAGVFGCYEVTIGFGGRERVDYITLDTKGIWRCYEIKASVSDFRSKAKKSFVGHLNYFVMTKEVYEKAKSEIPSHIGVYTGQQYVRCIKRAKKQELTVADEILKMSLIRSLSRDAEKLHRLTNPRIIEGYTRRIERVEKESFENKLKYMNLQGFLYRKYGRNWREQIGFEEID